MRHMSGKVGHWVVLYYHIQHLLHAVFAEGVKGFGIAAALLAVAGIGLYWYLNKNKPNSGSSGRGRPAPYLGGGYYYSPKRL
jgi:hypothetical protein